jgi:hypothetical protein
MVSVSKIRQLIEKEDEGHRKWITLCLLGKTVPIIYFGKIINA